MVGSFAVIRGILSLQGNRHIITRRNRGDMTGWEHRREVKRECFYRPWRDIPSTRIFPSLDPEQINCIAYPAQPL